MDSYIGTLWYPQNSDMHHVREIWDSVLQFDELILQNENKKEWFYTKVGEYLALNNEKIYGTGEWKPHKTKNPGHRVIQFSPNNLGAICTDIVAMEFYTFPEDFEWLFTITHESFSFLAGSADFIVGFKEFLPEWSKYVLYDNILNVI